MQDIDGTRLLTWDEVIQLLTDAHTALGDEGLDSLPGSMTLGQLEELIHGRPA